MADIDLKAATPDTSLPTTGFLFGADSQASASPSVYSTQTVATTLLGSTSLTGATITTSQPVLDLSQTWNASGVTFTGLKFNATDTASAAGSLLMDLQVGGTSQFSVRKNGDQFFSTNRISFVGTTSTQEFQFAYNNSSGNAHFSFRASSAPNLRAVAQAELTWVASTTTVTAQPPDTILTRRGPANLRLGAADAAGSAISISSVASNQLTLASNHGLSNGAAVQVTFTAGGAVPAGTAVNTTYYARSISAAVLELYGTYDQALNTASTTGRVAVTTAGTTAFINRAAPFQTLSVQSFTGTDIPGQPFVITGSQGTGTGAGGSIIFQVAPAGTTGSAQNALTTALTIGSDNIIRIPQSSAYNTANIQTTDGYNTGFTLSVNTLFSIISSGTGVASFKFNQGLLMRSALPISWSTSEVNGSGDTFLYRDTSNTLALRNGTNAQTFNIYNTFTSSTNFERFRIVAQSAAAVLIGTEKGSGGGTARALELQTDATTRLTIGSGGGFTIADAQDIAVGSTTGTKIGTATTQKIGFYNATPVVQPTAVADATDNATAITQLNALLAHMRTLGLIAT